MLRWRMGIIQTWCFRTYLAIQSSHIIHHFLEFLILLGRTMFLVPPFLFVVRYAYRCQNYIFILKISCLVLVPNFLIRDIAKTFCFRAATPSPSQAVAVLCWSCSCGTNMWRLHFRYYWCGVCGRHANSICRCLLRHSHRSVSLLGSHFIVGLSTNVACWFPCLVCFYRASIRIAVSRRVNCAKSS